MAEHKTSFVLYTDLVHTTRKLTDEQAGKLFKHILEYVNDNDPALEDALLSLVFVPIECQLKRDLERWRKTRAARVESGRKGGKQRALKQKQAKGSKSSKGKQTQANQAVNVNANVNVNVTVLSKEREELLQEWLEYRKEIGKRIKNKKTVENLRKKFAQLEPVWIRQVMDFSIDNQYQGLFFDRKMGKTAISQADAPKTAQENLQDFLKQSK